MAEALAALPLPGARLQVNNRKLIEGFYRGLGAPDTAAVMRVVDKLDKFPREAIAAQLVDEAGLAPTRPSSACGWPGSGPPTPRSSSGCAPSASRTTLLDEGLAELAAVVEGCAGLTGTAATGRVRSRPTCASPAAWTTTPARCSRPGSTASSGSGRSAPAAATSRWRATAARTYPGVGISLGVSRLLVPLLQRGVLAASRSVPSAVFVALVDDDVAAALAAGRHRPALARHRRARSPRPRRSSASRSAPPNGAASRSSGSPARTRPTRSTGEVKDIRCGDQVAADATQWTPPAEDLRPASIRTVELEPIVGHRPTSPLAPARTHRDHPRRIAPTPPDRCVARTPATPSCSPVGWPAAATTAESRSSTCATPAACARS